MCLNLNRYLYIRTENCPKNTIILEYNLKVIKYKLYIQYFTTNHV